MKAFSMVAACCLAAWPACAAPSVMGYFEGSGSVRSLHQFAGQLRIVAADQFAVDAQGALTGSVPASLARIAASHGLSVLVTVSNWGRGGFSPAIAHAILTAGAAQDAAIANMVAAAGTYAGINLDFESVKRTDRAGYTAFASSLASALHQHGKLAVLSLPAETQDNPNDSWTGAYDYAALGRSADLLQVMTYDENGPWSKPGPVAGLDWVTACLQFSQTIVPPGKISLGVPAYGYDWNLTRGSGSQIAYAAVPALLHQTGAAAQWDSATSSPWFDYTAADGSSHVVWYENARSITRKAALAAAQGVQGISMYALGFDDTDFWHAVARGFGE
jgi:spore germination protein